VPKVDPSSVRAFASSAELELWLGENHARARELWLCIHKRASGLPSVTYAEALDVALAWGWIDGLKKSLDERSFLQRFTPRRPRSSWSQRNRDHVERLERAGRMRPPGVAEVEAAKADGRWAAAYAPPSLARIPAQLLAAIEAVPAARATLARLDSVNRFALAHRFGKLKTDAGRERAIERYVQMLARGETLHPLGPGADRKAAERSLPAKPKPPTGADARASRRAAAPSKGGTKSPKRAAKPSERVRSRASKARRA
jgi:uncharacterized protein YdeI (YjbR/CyaY-like superfamily)